VSWVQREPGNLRYGLFLLVFFFFCLVDWIARETYLRTQFVNLISGSNLATGDELESCTNVVQPGKPFDLDGRRVVLIDTPGFDDTVRSDVDVLNMIAAFLETS